MADRISKIYANACKKGVLNPEKQSEDWFRQQISTEKGQKSFYDFATQNGMKFHPYEEWQQHMNDPIGDQPARVKREYATPRPVTSMGGYNPVQLDAQPWVDKEEGRKQVLQRQAAAKLPTSPEDEARAAEIRRLGREGMFGGTPSNFEMGVDENGHYYSKITEGEQHLLPFNANQEQINQLLAQQPEYMKRPNDTEEHIMQNIEEAVTANTEAGRAAKANLEQGQKALITELQGVFDATERGKEINQRYSGEYQQAFQTAYGAKFDQATKQMLARYQQSFEQSDAVKQIAAQYQKGLLTEAQANAKMDAAFKQMYGQQYQQEANALWKKYQDEFSASKEAQEINTRHNEEYNTAFAEDMDETYQQQMGGLLQNYDKALKDIAGDFYEGRMREMKHNVANKMIGDSEKIIGDAERAAMPKTGWERMAQSNLTDPIYGFGNTPAGKDDYLMAAHSFLDKAKQRMNDVSIDRYQAGDFTKNVGYDLKGILESTMSFGLSDLRDAHAITSVFEKVNSAAEAAKAAGKDPQDIFDNPSSVLNDKERAVYDAYCTMMAADIARQTDTSYLANAARLTAEMIPFMLEVGAMNGIFGGLNRTASRAITRGMVRSIVNKLPRGFGRTAARGLTGLAANLAGASLYAGESAAMAFVLPRTYANMLQNKIKVADDPGAITFTKDRLVINDFDVNTTSDAFWKAWRDEWKELFTETGGVFQVAGGLMFKNPIVKQISRKVGQTPMGKLIDVFSTGRFFEYAKQMGYHGTYKEWLEEVEGTCWDYVFGDEDAFEKFFSRDTQIPMLMSFSVPSVIGGGVNAARELSYRSEYKKASDSVLGLLNKYGYSAEDLDGIKQNLYATNVEDIPTEVMRMASMLTNADNFGDMFGEYTRLQLKSRNFKLTQEEQGKMDALYNELFKKENATTADTKALASELTRLAYAEVALSSVDRDMAHDRSRAVEEARQYYRDAMAERANQQQTEEEQQQARITQEVQAEVQPITHQDGNLYHVGVKGKDGVDGYVVSGNLNLSQDEQNGSFRTSGRDLVTIKMTDGTVQQVPADEVTILDAPMSATDRVAQEVERRTIIEQGKQQFHAGDKVQYTYVDPLDNQLKTVETDVLDVTDEGVVVAFQGPNGVADTTPIPFETAMQNLQVIDSHEVQGGNSYEVQGANLDEEGIVTFRLPDNRELHLRDMGNGTYETLDAEEGAAPHRFTDADLAQLGAQRVDQPGSGQPPMRGAQPPLQQEPLQGQMQAPQAPMQPVSATPQAPQIGSNAPGIDKLSAEDFAAQTVEFMQSPKVAQGYLTAERAKVNAQLQQLEKEGVTEYNSAEEYRTKAQQLEQSKARLQAQLEKIDGAIAAINAQAEAAVARKNLNEAIRKRAAEFSKQLGANIVIFDSLEQIPESQAEARAMYQQAGDAVDGWYDPRTGDIYMNANAYDDIQRFEEKVFHEVVSHKGLEQLLGTTNYNALCDAVWDSMDEATRKKYMDYAKANNIAKNAKGYQRIAAKEYIAFLSESFAQLELKDQSAEANAIRSEWAKICDFLRELFKKIFGNVQITNEDLAKLVHASFVNMQRQAQGITEEQGETNGVEAIFKPIMDAVAQWQGQPLINGLDPKKIGLSALNPDYARNKIRQIQELLNKPEKTAEDVAAIDGILGELYGALNTLIGSRQGGNENNNAESLINDIALQIAKSGAISQELLDSYVNEFAAAHNEEVNYGNNGMDSYIGGNSMWMRSALDRESGNTHDAERAEKKRRKEEAAAAAAAQKKITEEQQAVIDQLSQESAVGTTFVDGKSTYTITGVAHENEDGDMVVPVHVEKNGKTRDFEEDAVVIANKMLKAKPAAPVKQETKEPEEHTAAEFLNEALTETAKGNVPANVTIDETTIRDEEDSVEMDARLLIDGKPSNLSVTIFDQSLGSRGGYDPANLVKYYPFDNADNWSWEKADVLVNFFNKGEHSGKASVLDESDAVYFTSLQAAMEFDEFVNSEAANSPEVRLALAEAETDPNPTEAQKKAENYKQGHVTLWGLPITIENPKGSIRRGTDANGKQWEQEMHHTYGKIRRTEGVDGDHIDVFIGPNLTSDKVFVVDQRNVDTGEFDEHKCMLGFDSLEEAQNGYLSNYEEGWQGMGTVTEVTMDEFKKWIDSSTRKTKPFAEYKSVKTEGAASTAMEQTEEEPEIPAEEVKAMLDKLRALVENEEDQQAPQDYLHSLTDNEISALESEANDQWNAMRREQGLSGLNDPQIREKSPEGWKMLLLRNRVGSEGSRRWDMDMTEQSIANRKEHTESDELRRYYEYEFDYMRASARRDPKVTDYINKAQEYLAKLSYDELAKIYNEVVRLQSEHDVPWILTKAYRDRTANMSNAGVFDYGLKQQGDIPAGKANKPKINANDWTANDELRPVMNGVYHDVTGVGVATNAHILLATPALYNPEHEGKIILKNGSTVDGKFPNWQGVFDQARRVCVKEATVDWDAIRNFIAGVKAKMKAEGHPLKKDSLANIIIRMPDGQVVIYRMNMFIPFADAAASVGANTLHYSPINGQTYAENNGSQLIIMPVDPESFKKAIDWGDVDNFYYDLQTPSEGGAADTPAEAPKAAKPKPIRKKAAPAEQTQAPVETDAEVIETQKPKNTDKIEDVGEKIGGARKDIVQETVDRINVNGDTFAKIFPKFDYHKLIANGLEPRLAAGLKYVCEHAKKSYKIRKKRFGEKNALEATRFMANYAKGYLLGDTSLDFTSEGWVFTAYGKRRYEFGIKLWESLREAMGDTMFDVDLSGYDCDIIPTEEERRAEAVEAGRKFTHSTNVYYRRNADGESVEFTPRYAINTPKGDKLFTAEEYDQAVQYFQDQVTSAINYQAANPFELAIYRKRGSDDCCVHAKIGGKWVELTPWGKEYGLKYRDEHRAELQAMAQRKAEELKEQRKNTRPEAKVEVKWFSGVEDVGSYRIATKIGKEYVPISEPMLPKDIWRYAREHHDELQAKAQELLNAYLDEQEANRGWKPQLNIGGLRNRVGTDWRNGADVTAERFRTEFGFRGVEFGNYVTQKERQRLLNECFDALHDMAGILGVSPRALSLNGQLGFAIGARGGAGAKAHYEPGKNVINLTKKNGWGALAHEWWHAMDYYFGKREKERPATGGVFREDVRKEMQDAFAAVMKAINGSEYLKRSQNLDAKTNKRYYAEDTELGARAFEDYIAKQLIARGQVNDFLSHHTSEEDWNGDISNYPYPIEKDGTALADAFQSFFDTVEEQEDASSGNSVLFSVTDKKYAQFALTQANNPMLDDVHTGIRSVEDIHTLEETLNDDKLLVTEPDWEEEDIRRAIEDNQVTIYSSKPIQDGTFVTPSRMVAEDYAGGEMVYEKTVSPDKVAWIASDEGQYADTDHYNGNILFSITNANNDIFYSNAERAVEGIKQDKATPEQWRAMIEKAGGLKAGEDKWIGLSDWLAQQRPTIESHPDETPLQFAQRAQAERKKFTISKQDILDYIRQNKIQIEETEYGETTPENNPTFRAFQDEVTEMWENVNRMQNERFNEAVKDIIRYEDELEAKYGEDFRDMMDDSERNTMNYLQERRDEINMEVFLPEEVVMEEMCNRHGDDFQLAFSIDDDGSLSIANEDAAGYYLDVNPINDTRLQYTTEGLTNKHEIAMTVPTIESWNETDEIHFGDAGEGRAIAWVRFGDATDEQGNKVLVIDEIQSKRHQEGREKGYRKDPWTLRKAKENLRNYIQHLKDKYRIDQVENLRHNILPSEGAEWKRLQDLYLEEAEYTGASRDERPYAAPFEKNWHELAMKRILRFAAENGYDKVAWTTGDQQAERYDIGEFIESITRNEDEDYPYSYEVVPVNGSYMNYDFDENGIYHDDGDPQMDGKSMEDIFGKDLAKRLKEMPAGEKLDGNGLRIGAEGMKGFYDEILPRFLTKYGKKWGAQVGSVQLPELREKEWENGERGGLEMHSIDITPEMRESVLQGQPMFSITPKAERIAKLRNSEPVVITGNEIAVSDVPAEQRRIVKEYMREHNLKGEYTNADTGSVIQVQYGRKNGGVMELLQHDFKNPEHIQSIAAIPQIIEKSIYIDSAKNWDKEKNPEVTEYQYFVCGLKIGDEDYTVRSSIAIDRHGNRYYDHKLTHMEKGKLLDLSGRVTNPARSQAVADNGSITNSERKDNTLFSILQINPQENAENLQNSSENADLESKSGENGEQTPKNTSLDQVLFSITVNHNSPYLLKKADGSFVDPATGERLGFDHRFMGRGEGGQAHGWGSYFSVNDIRSYGEGYGFSLRDIKDIFNTSRWQSFGVGDAFDVAKNYLLEAQSEHARSLRKWLEDRLAQKQELLKSYEGKVANSAEEDLMVFRAEADVQYIPALLRDMVKDIDTRNRHHYDVEIPQNNGTNYIEEDAVPTNEQVEMICSAIRTEQGKEKVRNLCKDGINGRDLYRWLRDERFGSAEQTSLSLSEAGFVGIHYDGRRDGECYVIFDENDAKIVDHVMFSITEKDPLKRWEAENPKPEAKEGEPTIDYAKRLQQWNNEHRKVKDAIKDAQPSYDHAEYDGVLFSTTPPFTGETIGDLYAGARQRSDLNRKRRESAAITDMLIKLSKDNYWRMQEALHKINADIKSLRRAMRLQSNLDKKQVEELLHLYQSLIESTSEWAKPGDMPETTGMIFKNIVESIGKEDITEQINNIMVYLSAAQRTAARNQWYKLRTTELKKLNISGVVTQGKVAVQGQHAIQALNEALAKDSGLTLKDLVGDAETGDEGLIGRMMEEEDKATTESLKMEYKGKWIGYTLAAQHMERMEQLNSERKELLADLRAAENNEHLKPFVKAELIERLRQSLVDNDIAKADAYMQSTTDLQDYVTMQTERAKNFLQHLEEWSRRIRNMAAEDLSGVQADPLGKDRKKSKVLADLSDWQFSTARDMQSLLRFLGRNTPDGKGALYNHYFYGYQRAADTEFKGIMEATDTMGKKVAEIFGKGYKTFEDVGKLCRQESKRLKLELKDVFDGVNNVDIPISVDNALYIYAVSKMDDGMDKLLAMNISREDVANLIKDIDPRLIELVDWVQNEFFVNLRNRYNPTHESLYGAPMDKIENYFPLRIARGSLQKNVDVAEDENDASRLLPGTSTGAIKRRTKNAKPLDILAAGFLTETVRHITQMEKWNAFAQWTRDTNILLSDIMFRERVKALNSYIYGENGDVYAALKKAMQMANGTYKPAKLSSSNFTLNVAKGSTSAKINFRIWTAMKQIASHPAVIPYLTNAAAWKEYGKIMVNPYQALYGARQWALETLPAFQKRISKRDMGDMRLMRRAGDWEWQRKILEASAKYGMFCNMYVDTLTCAHIAKVAYESTKADLLTKGYTEEQATEKALLEAEIAFNTSQQSSESGYMAPVQSDRTWDTVVHTVFRVSPIQYTREWLYYGRNIGRKMKKGAKERMVDSRMRFYMLDGLSREQAQKAAESDYRKALAKDIAGFTVYGWLMNAVWRLMAAVPYLLLGDDDDEKKKLIKRAMTWGFYASPITGLFWGGALESALDRGDVAELFDKEMPITSDIVKAARLIKGGKAAEVASASLNVLVQSTIGFDIAQFTENIADAVIAVKSDQDMSNFKKARLVAQAMMSVPKSQWEQVLIDKAVEDAPKQTNNAVAKRNYQKVYDKYLEDYIEYYSVHQAPLTFWARGEENEQKMRENAEKKYRKLLRERGIDKDVLPDTKASRDKKKKK